MSDDSSVHAERHRVQARRPIDASALGADAIEFGLDGAPKAFRIWKAGVNSTDHGAHRFTSRSAELVMDEQFIRGNLYSIDVDHLSLSKDAPPEARKAVGFHRLEVRHGELWAVDVEWTDVVRAGLTKQPPEWRYFSPAYDINPSTLEIISYVNTALTNNPATWSVTALAARSSYPESLEGIPSATRIATGLPYGVERAARLPPSQHAELRERMSGEAPGRVIGWDKDHKNNLVFPQITKEEARRLLATRAKAGTDGPPRNPAFRRGRQ